MAIRKNDPEYQMFKRPCHRCEKSFIPTSKANFICDECCKKSLANRILKVKNGNKKRSESKSVH